MDTPVSFADHINPEVDYSSTALMRWIDNKHDVPWTEGAVRTSQPGSRQRDNPTTIGVLNHCSQLFRQPLSSDVRKQIQVEYTWLASVDGVLLPNRSDRQSAQYARPPPSTCQSSRQSPAIDHRHGHSTHIIDASNIASSEVPIDDNGLSGSISSLPSLDSSRSTLPDSHHGTNEASLYIAAQAADLHRGLTGEEIVVIPAGQEGHLSILAPSDVHGSVNSDPNGALDCVFHFLSCPHRFDSEADWIMHCNAHLRRRPPPQNISCPFCGKCPGSWTNLLSHVVKHQRQGRRLALVKPDPQLVLYLYRAKIIEKLDLRTLVVDGGVGKGKGVVDEYFDARREMRGREGREWGRVQVRG